jgi:hypothetical protein
VRRGEMGESTVGWSLARIGAIITLAFQRDAANGLDQRCALFCTTTAAFAFSRVHSRSRPCRRCVTRRVLSALRTFNALRALATLCPADAHEILCCSSARCISVGSRSPCRCPASFHSSCGSQSAPSPPSRGASTVRMNLQHLSLSS